MFDKLALHDATLTSAIFNWAKGICTLRLEVAREVGYDLKFSDVSEILIPSS